jgi:hypothetical protein
VAPIAVISASVITVAIAAALSSGVSVPVARVKTLTWPNSSKDISHKLLSSFAPTAPLSKAIETAKDLKEEKKQKRVVWFLKVQKGLKSLLSLRYR